MRRLFAAPARAARAAAAPAVAALVCAAFVFAALAGCSSAAPDVGAPSAEGGAPAAPGEVLAPALSDGAAASFDPFATAVPTVPTRAYAAVVLDVRTGRVLHETGGRSLRYPASLTKMMTLYLLFEALEAGRLSPSTPLTVSANAASRPPTKLGLKPGSTITVDMAARALAVRSSNDAAVAVAENLAGSEEAFARAMTLKARELGLSRTTFVNASGLPDERQVTTAYEMALLGKALALRFPRRFAYFSLREVSYGGRTWKNTNRLLDTVEGMDGIKTGYIRASGYNLVASVRRDGKHIIAVVIGGRTGTDRNSRMETLIEEALPKASGGGLFGALL